jgi:hypothetical protein
MRRVCVASACGCGRGWAAAGAAAGRPVAASKNARCAALRTGDWAGAGGVFVGKMGGRIVLTGVRFYG